MNKPIVINMFSGPGCGKSTTAAGVFSLLKMHEVNVELVTEFAKDLTWEERFKALNNQYYVWGKQYHRMWRIKDSVDVIVTDSPTLLGIVYGKNNPKCFHEIILHSFNEFDNMSYFLLRMRPYNSKGRSQTDKEARQLDNEIGGMLERYSVEFKVVPGNYLGINDIAKQVLIRLGKEMKIYLKENKNV